ncbi:hypothetical protein EC957_001969 [Mortierella hygrophila]|uniref:Uncharacterized protein n=1 Tax=Mortierella hygrophila TaxID=979708 RepID=A0A9P6F5T2_9FUNG|nr:hypothetical protein EC957_001969 [Mortierella hygrophila]
MLYRRSLYWEHHELFKSKRASGVDISRAISLAWRYESPEVRRKFNYEAELERVRYEQLPSYQRLQSRKRKSEATLMGSTGGEGSSKAKGKGKGKGKAKDAKGNGGDSTIARSGSGLESGLSEAICSTADATASEDSADATMQQWSNSEGGVTVVPEQGMGAEQGGSSGSHALTRTTGTSGAIHTFTSSRSRSSFESSSSSDSSTSLPSLPAFQMQAANGAPATALPDGGAFETMRICEDDGSAQVQDGVILSSHHDNRSHFAADYHQEGEGEGEGDDGHGHGQSDDFVALGEDQIPIKKRKSCQPTDHDHHRK